MDGLGHTLHKPWKVLKQEEESITTCVQREDKVTKPQLRLTAFLLLTPSFHYLSQSTDNRSCLVWIVYHNHSDLTQSLSFLKTADGKLITILLTCSSSVKYHTVSEEETGKAPRPARLHKPE